MTWMADPETSIYWRLVAEDLRRALENRNAALREIIDLDHHNHGPESRATKIARAALSQ
jgi:hypothetical protein